LLMATLRHCFKDSRFDLPRTVRPYFPASAVRCTGPL
jgi:hypothetical protein